MLRTNDQLRRAAMLVFEAGVRAADAYAAVERALAVAQHWIVVRQPNGREQRFDLRRYRRIVIVGAGKAAAQMARAVEHVLQDVAIEGLVSVKVGHSTPTRAVEVVEAGHPIPDEAGMLAARRTLALVRSLGEESLILCLLSGGASALWPAPALGISLADKQAVTEQLLKAGATIGEINAVRKHLSDIKGGQLARAASPAVVISLVLSDVVGDPLDVIASGPTVPDGSTFAQAQQVVLRYGLWDHVSPTVRERLEAGAAGAFPETPGVGDPCFTGCMHVVVGSNELALQACRQAAHQAGWNVLVLASTIEGEAREIARQHAAIAREVAKTGSPICAPACIISGGETTVTVRGHGVGGRNQEFALAAALELEGQRGVAVASLGTDGTDGPTDAAGAIAFGDSVRRAAEAGFDARAYLEDNDAYTFFDRLGDLIRTGPTGTNVMDIHVVLVASS